MYEEFKTFVDHWHQIAIIWAQIALASAALIFIYYQLAMLTRKTKSKKYEYMGKNEIRFYWLTALFVIISFVFLLNSLMVREHATDTEFVLFIKISVSLSIGFAIAYFVNTYLRVYYPYHLEKKLHKLRFTPRISPLTNLEMRLLTEDEEDVHLTKDMIEHENLKAYEYDVWLDDKSDYKLIETYKGNLHLEVCEKCNYRTAHEYKEELEIEPTEEDFGLLKKTYKCSYCDHEQSSEARISKLSAQK